MMSAVSFPRFGFSQKINIGQLDKGHPATRIAERLQRLPQQRVSTDNATLTLTQGKTLQFQDNTGETLTAKATTSLRSLILLLLEKTQGQASFTSGSINLATVFGLTKTT